MYLIVLFVVDATLGFSFHFQRPACFTVYKMGLSGGLRSHVCLSWTDLNWLVSMRRLSHSPFKDDNELDLILGHSTLRALAFSLVHIKFLSLSVFLFPSHSVWMTY